MPWSSCAASSSTFCQKASYASAATACSPIASASSYCRWHAPCSPPRAASSFPCRRCPTATSGTVPAAEKTCVSFSASPQHNSSWQDWIPHDHLRQPAPPACSTHVLVAVWVQHEERLQNHPRLYLPAARSQTILHMGHSFPPYSAP